MMVTGHAAILLASMRFTHPRQGPEEYPRQSQGYRIQWQMDAGGNVGTYWTFRRMNPAKILRPEDPIQVLPIS